MKKLLLVAMAAVSIPALAANDPDSIGRTMKFLDWGAGKSVLLYSPASPSAACDTANIRCIALNAAGTGSADIPDLTVVEIGANSSRSLLCGSIQYTTSYVFRNFSPSTDTTQKKSMVMIRPTLKIESAVLNDLSLVNPLIGAPFNGSIVRTQAPFFDEANLSSGQFEQHGQTWTQDCTRGLLSRSILMKDFGLSSTIAQRVMSQPIKLTFGVTLQDIGVSWSNVAIAVRMYSD